ncbi:MAG: ABC transporter substrate-binding protein, partial [Burkholderiaceae bacterium]
SDIEGLFIGMPGAPGISFFQQARAVGLDKKLKVMGETSGDVALIALGKDMPNNVWSPVFWPYEREPVKSNKISQQMLADYAVTTGKRFPNGHVLRGSIGLRGLLEGIKKAKTTDVPSVIAALEDISFESEIGAYTVRKADHAGMATLFVGNYNRVETEPFITLKEVRTVPEISVIETPSPGKEYIQ